MSLDENGCERCRRSKNPRRARGTIIALGDKQLVIEWWDCSGLAVGQTVDVFLDDAPLKSGPVVASMGATFNVDDLGPFINGDHGGDLRLPSGTDGIDGQRVRVVVQQESRAEGDGK
jgi:hypothetical protein